MTSKVQTALRPSKRGYMSEEKVVGRRPTEEETSKFLHTQNIVVFDCEIKEVVDGVQVTWDDKDKMGVSVACAYDYLTGDNIVFMDDNIDELVKRLNTAELVIGFNIDQFDCPLLNANCVTQLIKDLPTWDLLLHSRYAHGWSKNIRFPSGLKLDNHLKGTFGSNMMKTESGGDAPLMWKQKETGRLVSYCLADVRRERILFESVIQSGLFKTDTYGERSVKAFPEIIETFLKSVGE